LLPDMNIIVATWQSLLKQESAVADSENGEKVPTAEEKETRAGLPRVSDDVQTTLLKATSTSGPVSVSRVVPHLVAQSTFDFGKPIKRPKMGLYKQEINNSDLKFLMYIIFPLNETVGIVSEKGIREEVPPVLQYQILQVALELPANKFAWFKVQEVSEGGEKSIFYLLLKMFATCNKAQLKSSTRLLIIKVLRDSGVFEYTWKELDLWLRNLDKIADNSKNTVIQFLERTLLRLVSNPYPYTDKAAEIVQEASLLQLSSGKQDSETVSIPVSHIDDVLDMVDVIVEGSEGLDDEVGMALDEDLILQTFPFSAVVPVALEFRNSLLTQTEDEDDNVVQYLVSVLTDVLHSQRDPLALCLMLQCYDKEIKVVNRNSVQYIQLGQFNDYYSLWIPASAKETLFTECDDSMIEKCQQDESYSSLLKKTYASRDISKSDTEDVLNNAVLKLTFDELPLAVKHSLLCLKSTVDNFSKFKKGTGASLISLYLNLLHSLLCRFDLAKAEPHEKTAESQEESELFIDANYISSIDTPDNKILEDLLAVIFKHPTLECWFLALGRQSLPPHTLNPIGVKVLSSHVNKGLIQLLSFSAPLLQQNSNLHLISKYFSAIAESILKELEDKKALNKMSQPVEALQSLHPYLDTAQLNEITLAILRLPEDHLFVMKSPNHSSMDKQLSCYGKVLVQLLTESHQRKHQLQADLVSSVEHVKGVGSLLSPSSGGEMEAVLYEALQKDPVFSLVIGVHTLKYCLEQMTETCLSIAALLIEHSRTHLLQFELWCTNSGIQKSLRKNMEAFLPLIKVYLMCRSRFQFTRPSQVSSAALRVLKEAIWCKLVNVALSSEKSSEHVLVLSSIIRESNVSDEELQSLFDQLPVALAQSWNPDKWALADAVSQSADRSGKDMSSWKQALLASCMKCLIATYSANKESEASTQEAEKALLLHLKELMPFVKKNIPTEWKTLVKTGLKYRYKDCEFLAALREGIELWYGSESLSVKGLVELPVIHMMITQHSLFLPTLLRSREEQNENNTSREMLVDLLRSVVMKCPSVCDGNHFAVLLGAYGASLSRTDQKILLLLQAYEKNNISLTDFRLLLWGPAAVEHHKTRKSLGKSLWQQPSMEEILTLLDRERMMKTILHFPQHRKLVTEQDRVFEDSAITDLDDLYDPCFLLPLFSELIRPELVVDCLKFVDVNGLGLAVAALSSYDYNMRAAAYYILGTFLSHMEGARFRDKKQLQNLMDVVKNGIRQQNLRLTFSLTLYVAKAAQQILKPEEHMYIKICRFLLSHQYLDMKKVPDFYKLFYSFDLEHKLEREWILGLLNDGMRDRYCYELYDYQRIFHVLLTFYNSPLCDETSQNQILEVLQNAALVTKAAYQLIRDQSLLTWILNILERRYLANKMLANVILLVHNLWLTNLGNKESDCSDEEQSKEGSTNKKKFLPLHFVNEFFSVLMALLRHIRSNLQFIQLKQFFSTMSSVLSHRKVVLKAFKEMGRFAVNEKIFSAKDALVFLHKWSTIEKDSKLQERLSNLAQKYKVKELLDIIKEKYRPHDSRQLKKRKELEDQEDSEEQQEVISHLEDSRDHIKSILMHWEPVFSNTAFVAKKENANREGKLQTEDCNKDESSDTDQFVSATACLVANWILKTESEHAMNTQNIYKSIKWFNASIVPHTHVMQEIIKDSVLKNTIFRLFSRACSVTEMKVSSLELMRLFNTVMIRLIETQMLGKNAWHDAVKAICPDSSPDSARTAPGEFLVSLYVGDFWLGAEETGMLRSHVEVINEAAQMDFTGSKQKKPTRKKSEYEDGIVSLCKDLLRH
ncbi:nucleolar pre-ribosomal-associated protein 1, partial [Bombina bombina]|uniref:nucleolar pre-ribosomal-associated protein 1 n=1 Tax=Bombina bombina TaxID=8345 RepID=UPI00235AA57A